MNIKERALRLVLRIYMRLVHKIKYSFADNFDPKRIEPYILLGNHVSLDDSLYVSIPLDHYPAPIVNVFNYNNPILRFVLTRLIHTIPKRKGEADILTIRLILETIKRDRRGIMLYPEGNSSYYGQESPIAFSTAKLLKKLKLDIVICKVNGGYLANPRWANKPVKKGFCEVNYYTILTSNEVETIETEELYQRIVDALRFNDFEWNRTRRQPYALAHRAEGLERFIYLCPKCHRIQTITTKGRIVSCTHCGEIARFDEYSFLQGLPFDTLIEWGRYQKTFLPEIVKKPIHSKGKMIEVLLPSNQLNKYGMCNIVLENSLLTLENGHNQFAFPVREMKNITLTKKEGVSFDWNNKTYYVTIKDPMLILDAMIYLNGGYM